MAESVRVRSATADDAPGISALIQALAGGFTVRPGGEGAEAFFATVTEDAIRGYVASPAYRYLVAETEEGLAGVAALRDGRHLYHLFVAPPAQGRGLGRRLWMMLRDGALRSGNAGEFTVNASVFAVTVYERFGFRATGPRTEANGIAFVPMRLVLARGRGGGSV